MSVTTVTRYHPNGEIYGIGTLPTGLLASQNGLFIVGEFPSDTYYIDPVTQAAVEKGAAPSRFHEFDYTSKNWTLDIVHAQALRWWEIKQSRDNAEFSEFTWGGYTFDADRVSQARLQGAVQLANMNPAFQVDWTLADNSTVILDQASAIGAGLALGQHVMGVHAYARTLRTQIEAATTAAELDAIEWNL